MVISIASALYIVSLIPNVSLGLSAMKAFLFDERKSRFSSDLERTLLRMVKASRELSMPWAKRGILMREVRDRLLQDATSRGIKVKRQDLVELEQQALSPKNQESTVEILRDSLDAIASDRRLEKENRDLKAKVAELEAKLNRSTK